MFAKTLLRRTLKTAVLCFSATFLFVAAFAVLQPLWEPKSLQADMIVVLGGGMATNGRLHRSSTVRVEKGVALFKAGAAPRIHFTGGVGRPGGISAGGQMAKMAAGMGVPEDAISFEGDSYSTLQNGLFSVPYTKNLSHIILVTEGFHLPRSWASFKVFGAQSITLVHARKFRGSLSSSLIMVFRETLAIWFNAARFVVWKLAPLWDSDADHRNQILH